MQEEERRLATGPETKVALGEAASHASRQITPHDDNPVPNDPEASRFNTAIPVREASGEVIHAKSGIMSNAPMPGQFTKAERSRQAELEARERSGHVKHASEEVAAAPPMGRPPAGPSTIIEQPPAPQVTVQVAPTHQQPAAGRVPPPVVKEVVFAKAPPLDDWDKHVQDHAKKYGFDDAQFSRAQAVLKDLKRRANQYRMSRSDLFANAALKTDAKDRDAVLKDLNKPIDAMFEELKQRIDSLMTIEQRERAKTGGEKKPGK